MTGKTTLLRTMSYDAYFDLLDPSLELQYGVHPDLFWEQVKALEGKTCIIDEVQRVPKLLDYVQMGIDRLNQVYILSGSSARKLRRGGANLLGGRALEVHLHPLTVAEMDPGFKIADAMHYGTLPKIASLCLENQYDTARLHLRSYLTTYIKQEVQMEALTRNIGAFQRFLEIAGQNNAQVVEFANISRESSVAASTVKEYYQVLIDTLLGFFLWPYGHSERKKARPKFYFFDCGVARSIQNRLNDKPTAAESGFLFETWFINELHRLRDYNEKPFEFSFWRDRNHEIDLLVTKNNTMLLAFECKSGIDFDKTSIKAFRAQFPDVPLIVASLTDTMARRTDTAEILPWREALARFLSL